MSLTWEWRPFGLEDSTGRFRVAAVPKSSIVSPDGGWQAYEIRYGADGKPRGATLLTTPTVASQEAAKAVCEARAEVAP